MRISFGANWDIDLPEISNFTGLGSEDMACTITQSGQLFLLQQSACTIKNMSSSLPWNSNTSVIFRGSQAAIRRFTNNSVRNESIVAFEDSIYLFDRADTVFVLDTAQLIWREFKSMIPALLFGPSSALYSTSRWILLIRTDGKVTVIDGFDPYTFHWLGTLQTIETNANAIKAIPIQSSVEGSDSLLLVPTRSSDTQSSTATEAAEQFWRLDVPNADPTQIAVTPILPSRQLIKRALNSTTPISAPVFVTLIAADLAMFYQGDLRSNGDGFYFFNTTTLNFINRPQWLVSNTATVSSRRRPENFLAIILGSVIGGVAFIVILILLSWYYLRRKRKQNQDRSIDHSRHHCIPEQCMCLPFLCGFNRQRTESASPVSALPDHSQAPYLLSPIQPSSPLHIFPQDQSSSSSSLEKPTAIKSKFKEHFDLGSIAEFESNSNLSTRLIESPTTPNEKTASRSQIVQQ
ncbi:hypothetical protein BD560DRAFT_433572 [Blakeslea trispora]|nr:hypothetical protein BD560DRAFT_433572 [Blakeslea trispora]